MLRPLFYTLLISVLATASFAAPAPDTTAVYARVDTLDLKLDLYLPAHDSQVASVAPRPLIVWIHGGGWRGGSRAEAIPPLALLDSGYAIASLDYRLSQEAVWPAQIHDVKAAVRWLRANAGSFGLDTSRIAAWGASAGAHLASMLGVTTRLDGLDGVVGGNLGEGAGVRAVVDFYGASDFLEPIPKRWTPWSTVGQLLGCAVPRCPDRARYASPVEYVTADDAPFLIVHGTADTVVPPSQSLTMETALRAANVPVGLVLIEGAGHGGPEFVSEPVVARVSAFLREHLQPRSAAPQGTEIAEGVPGIGKTTQTTR